MTQQDRPTKKTKSTETERTSALKRVAALPSTVSVTAPADTADVKLKRWFMRIWTAVGAIILIGVAIYLLNVLALPVSMIIWTLLFIFMLRPLVNGLADRGMNRVLATTLSYIIMFVVLAAVCFLMFSPMFGLPEQFRNLLSGIPTYADNITHWFNTEYGKYAQWFENDTMKNLIDNATSSLSSWASGMASGAATAMVDMSAGVANAFMAIGFALVIAFWFLMGLPDLRNEIKRLLDSKYYDDAHFLHITFTRIMGGYIKGMILQCLLIGVACGILFAIAGIPNAPALGVITGVLNIIPIIGPWLGGAAAAITAVFVSPLTAVIALIGTIVIQQFVYTFISPKIMSNSVDVHPALTLIAMMFGTAIGGAMSGILGSLVGMLLAIPAVAVMKSCFVYYFEKRTGRQVVSEDGVFFKGTPQEDQDGAAHPLMDATSSFEPVRSKNGLIARFRKVEHRKGKGAVEGEGTAKAAIKGEDASKNVTKSASAGRGTHNGKN